MTEPTADQGQEPAGFPRESADSPGTPAQPATTETPADATTAPDAPPETIGLYYLGDGTQWMPGVPASDHNTTDAALAGRLVASGLYRADVDVPLPELPPAPAPEPEPAPPAPQAPFWWGDAPQPEAVAYARTVIAHAEGTAAAPAAPPDDAPPAAADAPPSEAP
jgi:hypothetical protein